MPHPRSDSIRLQRFHRYVLYAILAVLFFTGAAWAWFNHFLTANESAAAAKTWALKIHGAAAMAALVLIGTVLAGHVRFAWRAGRNRINGVVFLGALGILILTGYELYYAGGETLRAWNSWVHLWIGLALPMLLFVHIVVGRRSRRASKTSKAASFGAESRPKKGLKFELREDTE